MAHRSVSPEDLRFTQDSIKNTFKEPYHNKRIDDAVDRIGNNQLSPSVFMPLNVVEHESILWSLDNRRLWVLRKAGVPTVNVTLVSRNFIRRSVEFFSSLDDPMVREIYSNASYFPRVRGKVRSVGINRGKGMSDRGQMLYPTKEVTGAHKTTGISPALLPHNLRSGTVRIDMPAEVINYEANTIAHSNVCPEKLRFTQHSNVGSSSGGPPPPKPLLLHHPSNTTTAAPPPTPPLLHQNPTPHANTTLSFPTPPPPKKKGLGLFYFFASRAFDPCNKKFVTLGMNSLILLAICVVAVKADVGVKKMVTQLFSRMFCFLRSVVRNCVDLSKGIDRCRVIISECFSRLHSITGQLASSLGRMGIRVSQFCLQMFWDLLGFIKYQAFGFPGQMFCWSAGKVEDVLRFYKEEIKEILCKVAGSPQIALSFDLKKAGELGQGIISFSLNTIKEFLGLQSL